MRTGVLVGSGAVLADGAGRLCSAAAGECSAAVIMGNAVESKGLQCGSVVSKHSRDGVSILKWEVIAHLQRRDHTHVWHHMQHTGRLHRTQPSQFASPHTAHRLHIIPPPVRPRGAPWWSCCAGGAWASTRSKQRWRGRTWTGCSGLKHDGLAAGWPLAGSALVRQPLNQRLPWDWDLHQPQASPRAVV